MEDKAGCCRSCKAPCAEGFKKVVDLEYSGLVIYLHTKKDEKKKPPSRYDDSYVLHNTTSKELKKTEYIGELHKYKTKCSQCKTIIERVRSLLDEIKAIRENDILGVCEHCKQATHKNVSCKRCDFIVSKFIDIHRRRCAEREQRFKVWVCKVKHLLQALVDSESVCQHRVYKDAELERILQELKGPLSMREPDIDFFPAFNLEKLTSLRSLSQSKEMLEELLSKIKRAGEKRFSDDSLYPTPSKTCSCKHVKDGHFDGECLGLSRDMEKLTADLEAQGELAKDLSQLLNQELYKKMIKRLLELSRAIPQRWHQNKEVIQALLVTFNFAINQELSKDIIHKILEQLKEFKNTVVTQDFTKYLKGEVIMGLTSDFRALLTLGSPENLDTNFFQLLIDLTEMLADELSKNTPKDQSQLLLLKSVQEDIAHSLFKGKDSAQVRSRKKDAIIIQEPESTLQSVMSKNVPPNTAQGSPRDTPQGSAKILSKVTPIDSPRELSKETEKASVKRVLKDTNQGSPKSLKTLKDSRQGSPKGPSKDTVHGAGKGPPKDPMHGAAQGPPKDPMQGTVKGPPKDPMHGAAKGPLKDPIQGTGKGPPKDPMPGAIKGSTKDPMHGAGKGPPKDPMHGAAKGPPKDPMQGTLKGPPKDPMPGAIKGPTKDPMKGAGKGPPKDPMHGAAKGPPKDPMHGAGKGPPKDLMQGAAKGPTKDTVHGAGKGPPKDPMHGAAKGPPKDLMHGVAKGPPKDLMHGVAKGPPKDLKQGPDKETFKDSAKGPQKDATQSVSKGPPKETKQVSGKGNQKDSRQSSPQAAAKDTTQASGKETKQGSAKGPSKDPMHGAAKAPPKDPMHGVAKAPPKDPTHGAGKGPPKDTTQSSNKGQPKDKEQGLAKGSKETKPGTDKAPFKEAKRASDKPKETKQESDTGHSKEAKQTTKGPIKDPMHGAAKVPPKPPKDTNKEKPAEKLASNEQAKESKQGKGKEIPLALSKELNKELVNKLKELTKEYDNGDLNKDLTKEINAVLRKTVESSPPDLNTNVVNELSDLCDMAIKNVPKSEDVEVIKNFIKDCLKGLSDEPNKKEIKALLSNFNKALTKSAKAAKRQSKDIDTGKTKDNKTDKVPVPLSAIQKAIQNRSKDEPKEQKKDDAEGLESGEKDASKIKAQKQKKTKEKKDKASKKEKENLSPVKKAEQPIEEKAPKQPPDRIPKEKKLSDAILLKMLKSDKDRDAERHRLRNERQLEKEMKERERFKALLDAKKPPPVKKEPEVVVVPEETSEILECPTKRDKFKQMVRGTEITPFDSHYKDEIDVQAEPLFFKTCLEFPNAGMIDLTKQKKRGSSLDFENRFQDGIIRYRLSNREFIDKGWTKLPTKRVMRRMNIYKMEPVNPKQDWFERHKEDKELFYDTGVRLADIDANGRGHWYYRNGAIALDYYNAEESNIGQRYVVYSSGEENETGRVKPKTVLGLFDVLGNGVVYDLYGNVRLKYNQSEGLLVDPKLGPPGKWKWHTLNDPPVLQQVFVNARMKDSDLELVKKPDTAEDANENFHKQSNQDMLTIELDNFVKEKATKLLQKFKPFQIRMKAVKLNEQFSLKIFDQANISLLFRDGATSLKLNLGRVLKSDEIIDTDTSDMADVATPYDKHPARSGSVENIQKILKTVRSAKVRTSSDLVMKATG